MKPQDVITYNRKNFKYVKSIEVDENHELLRKILREKGPMTIKEIISSFKNEGKEKSEKSIYRYIKDLKDGGLITDVGKRVYRDKEDKTKSETLFGSTAHFFLQGADEKDRIKNIIDPKRSIEEKKEIQSIYQNSIKLIGLILKDNFPDHTFSEDCFLELIEEIEAKSNKLLIKNVEAAEEEALNLVRQINSNATRWSLTVMKWLSLIINEPELNRKISKCFEKK